MTATLLYDGRQYWEACRFLRGHCPIREAAEYAPVIIERLAVGSASPAIRRRATETLASLPAGYSNEEIVG